MPAFDVGIELDNTGATVDQQPPDLGYGTIAAEFLTRSDGSGADVSYFPTGAVPTNALSLLPPYVEAGADGGTGGGWNYYPGLDDAWSSADLSPPSPPRDIGPTRYSTSNDYFPENWREKRLGKNSGNYENWLLLGYNKVQFNKYRALGRLNLPTNATLASYYTHQLPALPAGPPDTRYSWVEINAAVQSTPILPSSVDIGLYITAQVGRTSGHIAVYAQWLPYDDTPVSDMWLNGIPLSDWTHVADMPYADTAGWTTATIDISNLAALDPGPYATAAGPGYKIAITFRALPDYWTLPDMPDASGPFYHDVTWTYANVMAHYDTGALKYRFVGPEIYEGGSNGSSHIGIVESGPGLTPYIVGESSGTITDTMAWPFSPANFTDVKAVARAGTRVGNSATFLVKTGSNWNAGKFTMLSNGKLSLTNTPYSAATVTVGGVIPDLFGGNESPRILMSYYHFSLGYRYSVFNLETGSNVLVSGLPANLASNLTTRLAVFSQGGTFLVMTLDDSRAGVDDLTIQRYTIAADGTATAVGPAMYLQNSQTPMNNDDYYVFDPEDVWDDGDYVAVGLIHYRNYAPYNDASLKLAIFNFTSPNPQHIVTLDNAPDGYFSYRENQKTITFSKTRNGYAVTYGARSVRPVLDSSGSYNWSTYVTRSINPATGELGPVVFGSDTGSAGFYNTTFIRADGGSTLGYIERIPSENGSYSPEKIVAVNADTGAEGVRTLVPWSGLSGAPAYDQVFASAWVGINGYGGYGGRLYFKYQGI